VIDGLVRITTRAKDGTRDENGTMVLLLDLEALSLTKHLDLAA
jgi:purine-binding chemotaxis protein CheW